MLVWRAASGAAAAGSASVAAPAGPRRYAQPDMRLAMRTSIGDPAAAPLRLVLLGDAPALGVGVERVADTVGGHPAALLAGGPTVGGRRIELSSVAGAGSHRRDPAPHGPRALLRARAGVP